MVEATVKGNPTINLNKLEPLRAPCTIKLEMISCALSSRATSRARTAGALLADRLADQQRFGDMVQRQLLISNKVVVLDETYFYLYENDAQIPDRRTRQRPIVCHERAPIGERWAKSMTSACSAWWRTPALRAGPRRRNPSPSPRPCARSGHRHRPRSKRAKLKSKTRKRKTRFSRTRSINSVTA